MQAATTAPRASRCERRGRPGPPTVTRSFDVAIVGGGIAGGSLACVLARGGLGVVLLERQTEYRDRVLGEGMMPWGVAEARQAGVEEVLLGNPQGSVVLTHWLDYGIGEDPDRVEEEALAFPLSRVVPGVDGILCVRHPVACEAFAESASRAGATVVKGATDVEATFGATPSVSWSVNGVRESATCRIVVGADGKVSSMRKIASIELREGAATSVTAGMLTGGLDGAPPTMGYSLTETYRRLISFPQAGSRSRLYVCVSIEERTRFTGPQGIDRFLAAWDSPSLPFGSVIANGRQDGPCGTFPLNSAFVDTPVRDGLVLIGDAAGWVDPLIGQGLAMAMRDARTVADVLLDGADWTLNDFGAYVEERRGRLEVLALNARVQQRLDVDFSPDFSPRRAAVTAALYDDDVFRTLLGTQTRGPEAVDPRVFSASERARLNESLGVPV